MNRRERHTRLISKLSMSLIATALVFVFLFSGSVFAQGKKPISKSGLLEALRIGGLTAGELIRQVEQRGVDFELTEAITAELRRAGAGAELIRAVGANQRLSNNPIPKITHTNEPPRASLGLVVQDITPALASSLGLAEARGVLVNAVEKNHLGDQAGVEQRDIIMAINDAPIKNSDALRQQMARVRPGEAITLTILRDGSTRKLSSAAKNDSASANNHTTNNGVSTSVSGRGKLGLRVEPLTPETSTRLKLERVKGLLVTDVDTSGPAAAAGIKSGDVIEEINGEAVRSMTDVEPALAKNNSGPARLRIHRAGKSFGVELKPRAAG